VPVPVDLTAVLLAAFLNPAVPVVAYWMGRNASQWQKLPIAAFVAALVGSGLIYLAVRMGIAGIERLGRAAAGIFIAQFVSGLLWAITGYSLRRRA